MVIIHTAMRSPARLRNCFLISGKMWLRIVIIPTTKPTVKIQINKFEGKEELGYGRKGGKPCQSGRQLEETAASRKQRAGTGATEAKAYLE